jgi:hypothetical protein
MPRLVVNPDSPEAWPIELPPGTLTLGRSEQNDVPIEHPSVSSCHCRITLSEDGAWLKDLGSTAGSFVDGELVEEVRLRPGQMLRLGEIALRFESDAPQAAASAPGPPLPPPMPASQAAASLSRCASHAQTIARFNCPTCERALCDLCVSTRQVNGQSTRFCRRCGSECQTLRPRLDQVASPPGFFASLPGALLYPFQGNGVILLVAGTVFFFIVGHLPLVGAILTGYLFAYAKSIITSTANGRKDPPDWPDFSDWKDDILVPYLHLAAFVLLFFGPAFAVLIWGPGTPTQTRIAYFAALGFGALFAPMGLLALAMFDTVAALNPIALAWSILRVPLHYLVAAAAFETAFLLYWFAGRALATLIPVPYLPDLISGFLNLYVISVGMRILGLLYANNQDELGWFSRLGH